MLVVDVGEWLVGLLLCFWFEGGEYNCGARPVIYWISHNFVHMDLYIYMDVDGGRECGHRRGANINSADPNINYTIMLSFRLANPSSAGRNVYVYAFYKCGVSRVVIGTDDFCCCCNNMDVECMTSKFNNVSLYF